MEKRPDGKEQRNRSGGSGKRKEPEKRAGSGKRILVEKSDVLTKQIVRSLSGLRKMTAERISPPILIGGVVFAAVLIGIILFMGRGNNTEAAEVSAGQKDNIKGFMFIFDKRSVQQRLVEDMKEGRIPLKLTCEKFDLIPNEDGTVSENIDESATFVTEDRDYIKQVYQEMTDMIVIGQILMRDNTTRCRITMVLQDGTDCVFNFDTVSVIEIEGQDYMMESDGGLWKLLPGFF